MNISLTEELETRIRQKVESGLYNNASEVIREALRFMDANEELVYQLKLDRLKKALAPGFEQADRGEYFKLDADAFFEKVLGPERG